MTSLPSLRRALITSCACAALATAAHAQFVDTFDSIDPGWVMDRTNPAGFDAVSFLGNSRLRITLDGSSTVADPWYNYQGKQLPLSVADSAILSIQLYVDTLGWSGQEVSTGIWGVGRDGANAISAYPIIQYRQGPTAVGGDGFYVFDYFLGGWSLLGSATADSWNTLEMALTPGVGYAYSLNGSQLGTFADPDTLGLSAVILNSFNFGVNQTIYYDNLMAVPEPATYGALMGLLVLGVVGYRRFRRRSA